MIARIVYVEAQVYGCRKRVVIAFRNRKKACVRAISRVFQCLTFRDVTIMFAPSRAFRGDLVRGLRVIFSCVYRSSNSLNVMQFRTLAIGARCEKCLASDRRDTLNK